MDRLPCLALTTIILVAGCGVQAPLEVRTNSLPNAALWQNYKVQMTTVGGLPPIHWSIAAGHLPPGVSLSQTGLLSGIPLSEGEFDFTVQATESLEPSIAARSSNLKLKVRRHNESSPLTISTTALTGGTVQVPYSSVLTATGGNTPYKWSLAAGSLPTGIALNASTGVLAGTPTASGQFSFTAEVQDSSVPIQHATQSLIISSQPAISPLRISTSSLPAGAAQVPYSAALSASGGNPPYSWSIIGGTLPAGLALNASAGTITGIPTQAGTFLFTLQVRDSAGLTASSSYSASIAPPSYPVVSSISPNSGPSSGGTLVTISGSNFQSSAIALFGGVASSSVTVTSATQIKAAAPAHIAGTVELTVQENGQSSAGVNFTYNALTPTVTGVSPNSGPTAGGTTVTITGNNFLTGALLLFGGVAAPAVTVTSGSQIQAVTPANAAGPVDVTVDNPGDLAGKLTSGFTYLASTPTISSISPTSGPAGTQVTIIGTNFETGATVSFGSATPVSATYVNSTKLTALVPAIATGTYNVTVTDPDPASAMLNDGFTVTVPASTQSLLTGCTVSPGDTASCAIPSGWTLATAQGFDSGSLSAGQSFFSGSSIECTFAHTGNCALVRFNNSGDQATGIVISGTLINARETYASWWEYLEPQTRLNLQMITTRRTLYDSSGNTITDLLWNWEDGASGCYQNCTAAQSSIYAEGRNGLPNFSIYGGTYPLILGSWVQYEVDLKANDPGVSNGSIRVYRNGSVIQSANSVNFNGSQDMSLAQLEIGGYNESLVYWQDSAHTVCSSAQTLGPYTTNNSSWSACTCSKQCPTNGQIPTFNRYIDDVIVLRK